MSRLLALCALLLSQLPLALQAETPPVTAPGAPSAPISPPPLEDFIERDSFREIKVSPDGRHIAATVQAENGGALVFIRRDTLERTGYFYAGQRMDVMDFWWAGDERVLMSLGEKFPGQEIHLPTGEIVSSDVDGSRQKILAGWRAGDGRIGSRVKQRDSEKAAVFPIDMLADSESEVLVAVRPFTERSEAYPTVERMNTRTGRRNLVTRSPVQRADFVTDLQGQVRFAYGATVQNKTQLYYRDADNDDWVLLNDEAETGSDVHALGFTADGQSAYLVASRSDGPAAVERMDIASKERTEVFRHAQFDPMGPIMAVNERVVIGVSLPAQAEGSHYFDPNHPDARLRRSLAAAFPGQNLQIMSATRDGNIAVIATYSDRNPGDLYLFDREKRGATHIGSRGAKLNPDHLGSTRTIQLTARDGLKLEGLLTLPPGGADKNLPMVVYPHGGPYGVQDVWGYDQQVQILATRGYAVLQLNFRGSSGYGLAFQEAGYRQWGKAMQDDLTDATHWAIEEGIADADRICIFGASYGGYASLMGAAKEPELYACAVGYVGVYDLEMMFRRGDIPQRFSGLNYLKERLGEEGLAETSPVNLAARIQVPVFLAAGGEDVRTPIEQTEAMERALERAGKTVETLYVREAGHGFYSVDNNLKLQTQLLAFLDRHIGAGRSSAAPASP
jgi:dipeptidyl aminopeptidase/acylaminoacyl peptidase